MIGQRRDSSDAGSPPGNAGKGMSFLPEDYVEKRIERRTNLMGLSLFGIVLLGVIGAYLVTNRHRAEVRAEREQVNAEFAEAARRLEQLDELQERKQRMLTQAQVTGTLVEPVPRTFLLSDLINRMPGSLSVFELQLSSTQTRTVSRADTKRASVANRSRNRRGQEKDDEDGSPAPPPQTVVNLTMVGVAPTDVQVAQYMSALSRSELLSDVDLVFSEETRVQEESMRRFRIEMRVDPTADVRRIEALKVPRQLEQDPMRDPAEPAAMPPLTGRERAEPDERPAAPADRRSLFDQITDRLKNKEQ